MAGNSDDVSSELMPLIKFNAAVGYLMRSKRRLLRCYNVAGARRGGVIFGPIDAK